VIAPAFGSAPLPIRVHVYAEQFALAAVHVQSTSAKPLPNSAPLNDGLLCACWMKRKYPSYAPNVDGPPSAPAPEPASTAPLPRASMPTPAGELLHATPPRPAPKTATDTTDHHAAFDRMLDP
jgi:hypothetical protein